MEKQYLLMVLALSLKKGNGTLFIEEGELVNADINDYYLVFRSTTNAEGQEGTAVELVKKDEWEDEEVPERDEGDSHDNGLATNYIPRTKLNA